MYQFKSLEDTIVAIATPSGPGGLGVIRLSGKEALPIATRLFEPKQPKVLADVKSYTVHYGWMVVPARQGEDVQDRRVDEVLLTVMRAPRSYTTEDVVEISCHGGFVVLREILTLILDQGARLAQPGEFTKRAFLNGRIDLPQAEAVLDVIQSRTEAFLRVSQHQLQGDLSRALQAIRAQMMTTYVELEALINFPEDEVDALGRERLRSGVAVAQQEVEQLLASSDQGQLLKEGIRIVLCGKPNVGKSSLMNVLLKHARAIVSPIAGTTRDTIEETAQIQDIPFQLTDTAGILIPRDEIEIEAVRRSQEHVQQADLVLLLLDASQLLDTQDYKIIESLQTCNVLVVMNKLDLGAVIKLQEVFSLFNKPVKGIEISIFQQQGLKELEEAIVGNVLHGQQLQSSTLMLSNVRHIESLKHCRQQMQEAQENFAYGLSLEFISENIKQVVNGLDAITGRNVDHDLLETIFSQFCIGK